MLRYLGVFAALNTADAERVGLSDSGRRIVGNQRLVLSEDLGIGIATFLSAGWLMPGVGPSKQIVTPVDVDVLLDEENRGKFGVEQAGKRGPDYLLVGQDADPTDHFGFLECKGAKTTNNTPHSSPPHPSSLPG